MIHYEVRLTTPEEHADALAGYMTGIHIPAILRTGCFRAARFMRLDGAPATFRTTYVAATRDDLDRYLAEFAPGFRAEFVRDMGDRVSATREVWAEVQAFGDALY